MRYIKSLDALRCFAVITVIITHWYPPNSDSTFLGFIRKLLIPTGAFGVNLFFVLSGYLVSMILIEAKKKGEMQSSYIIRNFIIRRALRIFPIYYLSLFFHFFINYPDVRKYMLSFSTYTINFVCFQEKSFNAYSHTWSLSVEEQFYLILPWLIIFIKERHYERLFVALIIIGTSSCFITIKLLDNLYGGVLLLSCLHSFGLGGLYGVIRKKNNRNRKYAKAFYIMLPTAICFYYYFVFFSRSNFIYLYRFFSSIVAVALLHFVLTQKSEWIKTIILENRVINYVGKISYGLYLYHYTLGPLYNHYIKTINLKLPVVGILFKNYLLLHEFGKWALLLFVSALSYEFIEKKILRLKDNFLYRRANFDSSTTIELIQNGKQKAEISEKIVNE